MCKLEAFFHFNKLLVEIENVLVFALARGDRIHTQVEGAVLLYSFTSPAVWHVRCHRLHTLRLLNMVGVITEKALRKTRHWMMPSMVSPVRQKVPVRWRPLRTTALELMRRSRESMASVHADADAGADARRALSAGTPEPDPNPTRAGATVGVARSRPTKYTRVLIEPYT